LPKNVRAPAAAAEKQKKETKNVICRGCPANAGRSLKNGNKIVVVFAKEHRID